MKNKIVIITGAAKGIGREVSKMFSKKGATVVLLDIDMKALDEIANNLSNQLGDIYAYKVDVSNSFEVNDTIKKIISKFKRIDILVNSAGIFEDKKLLDTTDELFDRILNVNLKGTFNCCRSVASQMIENRYGKIVNITSLAGKTKSIIAGLSYSTSKAGVIGLTRSIASELAKYNINVNAIAPSIVETDMLAGLETKERERIIKDIPIGRVTTIGDISNLIYFLASDLSKNITGEVININGGVFMD